MAKIPNQQQNSPNCVKPSSHLQQSSNSSSSLYSGLQELGKEQRSDGFTFGIAFASKDSFNLNQSHQLSPCDRRLSLSSSNSQLALFRPKVDEISLLTINTTNFFPDLFTIGLGWIFFGGLPFDILNVIGQFLGFLGSGLYAYYKLIGK